MSTSLIFEFLLLQNKTSSPKDFKYTRFGCILAISQEQISSQFVTRYTDMFWLRNKQKNNYRLLSRCMHKLKL